MNALVARRGITSRSTDERRLLNALLRCNTNPGADPVTITSGADGVDDQPVVAVSTLIHENNGIAIVAVDDDVDPPVIVQISESGSAPCQRRSEHLPALG